MSYFKAKMYQIRFRLRLYPRLRWGSLQRSPGPLAGFKGPTSKGREDGKKGQERGEGNGSRVREETEGREGRKGKGKKGGGKGKGKGCIMVVGGWTPLHILHAN